MSRPKKYTKQEIKKIQQKFEEYIDSKDIPVIAEFAYQNNITRPRLYELSDMDEEFSYTLEKCRAKKEAQLEILGLKNKVNSTIAVFSLKQLGWRDKQEIEHSGGLTIIDDA